MTINKKPLTVHFDIDKSFANLLKDKKYSFPLSLGNFDKISHVQKIIIASVKSNSRISAPMLKKMPQLRAIITRTMGTNHIDLQECRKKNIAVYHIPDYGAFAIAEHVFALLLSQTRKIIPLNKETKCGRFNWTNGQGYTLKSKTIGVIGVGKTGRETVKIAKGFQMKILGYDKLQDPDFAKKTGMVYTSLSNILKKSDVISINMPLLKQTQHFIGEQEIKKMKNKVILINVSRGELIDTKALVKNLDKFRYVCLDVLEDENIYDLKNPLINRMANSEKVLITPHIAFFTDLTTTEIARITVKNINSFLQGNWENRLV